jgi:hypothetical protein
MVSARVDAQVEVDVVIKPSLSSIILAVGLTVIIFIGIIVGAYIASTGYQQPQTQLVGPVVVNNQGDVTPSTPFANAYIRSASGYWLDNGKGSVGFSAQPQQTWSFDGQYLVNMMSFNNLYNSNNIPSMGMLPPPNVSRSQYMWVWNGSTLTYGPTAGTPNPQVVNDQGGALRLIQINSTVPNSAILTVTTS